MRYWFGLWMMLHATVALADEVVTAQRHMTRGNKWLDVLQYDKAIEAYEQAYQADSNIKRLYHIAESYDQMAEMADSTTEALKSKKRALKIYETFLAKVPESDPELEPFRKAAAARVEPLLQEVKEFAVGVAVEREELRARLKGIEEKLQWLIDHLLPQERNKTAQRQGGPNPAQSR